MGKERNKWSKRQEGSLPSDTQILVHGRGEEWKSCPKARTHEVIACQNRGLVFGVSMSLVGEDIVEDRAAANAKKPGG